MKLTTFFLVGLAAINLSAGLPSAQVDDTSITDQPTTNIPACGNTYLNYSDYISSPNYPSNYSNNADCYFYLDSLGSGISLQFYDIVTEECCDRITVYEGWSTSGRVLLQVSGNGGSRTVSTTETSRLLVHFYSDESDSARGFQASFRQLTDPAADIRTASTDNPVCRDNYLTDGGSLFSPSYGNYSNNLDCFWYLDSRRSGIFLRFNAFDTETGWDFVKVYEGGNTTGPLLLHHSGPSTPNWIYTSRTGRLLVHFHTDGSVTRSGFQASFGGYYGETVLTANSGQLTSLNYPNSYYDNMDYRWTIRVGSGRRIRVSFNNFDTEQNYDILTIYDGSTINSPQLLRTSGLNSLGPMTSSSNEMLIQFTTDHSVVQRGWSLTYEGIGCGDNYLFDGGYVASPSNPNAYSNDVDCFWYLDSRRSGIFLRFNAFDTEPVWDYVKVYEGRNTTGALLLHHSGRSIPNWIYTNRTGQLLVHFHTDGSITQPGFQAYFGGYYGETALPAESGQLTSLNYPNNYFNNMDYRWPIKVSPGKRIRVSFNNFYTEQNYDFLTIYDGITVSSPQLLRTSGNASLSPMTSSSNEMLIQFTTDDSVVQRGWSLTYNAIVFGESYLIDGGRVYSPSYGNYSNNVDYYWYLDSRRSGIFLRFDAFDTESGFDYVKVYEGRNTSGALLLQHSGPNIPNWIYTNRTGQLLVHFQTDGSVTRPGFQACFGGYYGETVLTASSGQLTSLNYPNSYFNNMDYRWTIRVSSGRRIRVTFSYFDTEQSCDFLTVYDGSAVSSRQLLRTSGNYTLSPVTSSTNEMLIQFTTDYSVVQRGWSLTYSTL